MVTVDLNGDGIPDVATSDQDGTTVDILLGTGAGAFQAARSFAAGNGPFAIAVGDMNGDGKPDLVLPDSNAKKNAVAILLGNGDGTFQAKKQFEGGAFPDSAALGDFNGDGRLDVVVTNASINAGIINVMLGNGDGTLQLPTPFTTAKNPRSVVVGDFDGNGRLDLAVATLVGNAVSVLLGNGNGTFQARQDYPTGTSSYA
ncbi:MAG: VCBS repeat-containing protein, partial [Chthoniobacterales bacterium]